MGGGGWTVAIWALLIVAAAWLVVMLLRRGAGPRETSQQILQHRLAAGEIAPQEYEHRKGLLDHDVPSGS